MRCVTSVRITESTSRSSTRAVSTYTAVNTNVIAAAKITTNSAARRAEDSRMRGGAVMRGRLACWSFLQNITRAPHRVNERLGEALVDGVAQSAHVHIGDVGLRIEMQVPHAFQQHGARHRLTRVAHQVFEQLELLRGQLDAASG